MGLIWENHSKIDCLSCQSSRQRPNKLHQCYTPAHNDHSHRGKEDVGSIHEFLGADAMEALRDHVCCHSYVLVSVPFSRITGEPVILSYMWEASSGNKEAIPSSKKKDNTWNVWNVFERWQLLDFCWCQDPPWNHIWNPFGTMC